MTKHFHRIVLVLGLFLAATSAHACGFEDPNSVMVQRGMLNMIYPNALHVVGALTQARLNGIVAPETDSSAKGAFAFNRTARLLARFGKQLRGLPGEEEGFAVTMVLIESMLWTRFSIRGGDVETSVHVDGSQPGDLVIVTGGPVLRQIADHHLTFAQAESLGLVRLYGGPQALARLRILAANH